MTKMTEHLAAITILIPSVCSEARHASLVRAIASAQGAASQPIRVVVVANGPSVSDSAVQAARQYGADVQRLAEGSLPKALAHARALVTTEFFGFLDDDDELLEGALDRRLEALHQDPKVDVAVSNGVRDLGGERQRCLPSLAGVADEPLRALLHQNWLASCAGLFRASRVGTEYFAKPHRYAEWTALAFQLCMTGRRVACVDSLDYVIHDTLGSLSKSEGFVRSYVELYEQMLQPETPAWAKAIIRSKRGAALHDLSVRALEAGRLAEAMLFHLRSLGTLEGLRYFSYGRHIARRVLAGILH